MANDPETQPIPTTETAAARPKRKRGKRRGRKKFWFFLLLLIAVAIGTQRFRAAKSGAQQEELKEPIRPTFDRVEERLLESGSVELRTTLEVKSKMSGKVKELLVEEGDAVQKDQVLAIIEPDPNEILRLYQKRAAVESRLISLQETERELERARQLHERKVMPGDQFERIQDTYKTAQTNYQLALLELQALEREINPAQTAGAALEATATASSGEVLPTIPDEPTSALSSLTDISVVAPISGLVIQRPAEVGELVISGTATTIAGTTIMELGDLREIIIRASINEVDIGKIEAGQEVKVKMSAYEDDEFSAKVFRISPIGIMGQNIVTFKVEIRFDELSEKFMPGMTCDLDILVDERNNVLTLPHHAFFQEPEKKEDETPTTEPEQQRRGPFAPRRPNEVVDATEVKFLDYVWVKKDDDWEKREVKLGLKGQKLVEILEGVTEADEIYPEAERMRWIMEERERKANKRWFWQKPKESADKQEESESAPAQSQEATEQTDEPVTSEEPDTDQLPEEDSQPVDQESPEAS